MIRATAAAGCVGCCHAIKPLDLTDRLGDITLPTVVLVGEDDPGTPVPRGASVRRASVAYRSGLIQG